MQYNKRYSIMIFAQSEDCYIYDTVERRSVKGLLFPSVTDARRYLRGTLNQRPCKVKVE